MGTSGTGRVRSIPSLLRFLARFDIGPDRLLTAAGIDLATLGDPAEGLPHPQMMLLWDAAVRLTGDPDFGLHLGEWVCQSPEEHFDLLAYAVRSCSTLGEHYRRMMRYTRLIHPSSFLSLEIEGNAAHLVHGNIDHNIVPRQPVECMLTISVLQARRATGDDFAPREVCFAHPRPHRTDEQERLFRAPVRYGCPRNEIVMDPADLERPQRHAEPGLLAVLERQLEELMSRIPAQDTFVGRLKRDMARMLVEGEPTLSDVAAKLRMSPRSLQRRLKDEGTSFAALLADVRCEMARSYLQDPSMTINEVTFMLGFAEVSAFHRAFKRWTGNTPAEYQRVARGPSARA